MNWCSKKRLTYFLKEFVRCVISGYRRGENEFALQGCYAALIGN
jgi:hypothetical protein